MYDNKEFICGDSFSSRSPWE